MIRISNISKSYGNLQAIDNISFSLVQGEVVGFLGLNGAGKSSTMKIITGVIKADKGKVLIFGNDLENEPIKAKEKTGYLSEDNPLPEDMYVREYLNHIAEIYKLNNIKETVAKTIDEFGLKNEYRKKIATLSKGNRQKLGLAQALIHNPDFLILDEPTSALDPNQQAELKELISELGKSKIILFSSHILHDVQSLASRIIIVDKGKIRADEAVSNIASVETLFYNITNENRSR